MAVKKESSPTYEQNLQQLQTIVNAMESDQIALADLVDKYQEGLALIDNLTRQLNEAKAKVRDANEIDIEEEKVEDFGF